MEKKVQKTTNISNEGITPVIIISDHGRLKLHQLKEKNN